MSRVILFTQPSRCSAAFEPHYPAFLDGHIAEDEVNVRLDRFSHIVRFNPLLVFGSIGTLFITGLTLLFIGAFYIEERRHVLGVSLCTAGSLAVAALFVLIVYFAFRRARRYRKLAAALDRDNRDFARNGNRMNWRLSGDGCLGVRLELEVVPGGRPVLSGLLLEASTEPLF